MSSVTGQLEESDCCDELPPPPSHPLPGLSDYDLLDELGRGGMGVVYRALHRRLNRIVALKLLRGGPTASPQDRDRFLREARAGAALQHPHIVSVFDVGEYTGAPYLAMEFVEGGNLTERLAQGPMPPRSAAELILNIAEAVDHAHQHGVIHRDLKPSNILVQDHDRKANRDRSSPTETDRTPGQPPSSIRESPTVIPKIADFGLARLLEDDAGTLSGTILGTPSYMAPEQAAGRVHQIGPASDVYSLGAILYECLTGRPPFRAATPVETLYQVETMEPVAPSRLQHSTPRDLSTICLECLQKDPRRRYASVAALADDLRRYLSGRPIQARPISFWEKYWRWCRRHPWEALLLGALTLAIVGGFIGVFSQWRRAEGLYTEANERRKEAESNLKRYEQATEDFADLIDLVDLDQLFNLRASALRQVLFLPALQRHRNFVQQNGADPGKRAEVVRAQIRVAVLARLLSQGAETPSRKEALAAGQEALAALEKFSTSFPDVVQYRRDRAALTQNVGFLLHSVGRSSEALPVLESAQKMRHELLNSQPNHLDFRSDLANTFNDIGLVQYQLKNGDESLSALQQAIDLQRQVVRLAPQVHRYHRFLGNHLFNRAMTLVNLFQSAEATVLLDECVALMPQDADQWARRGRIYALRHGQTGDEQLAAVAVASMHRAMELGLDDALVILRYPNFKSMSKRPDFQALASEAQRRRDIADRQ